MNPWLLIAGLAAFIIVVGLIASWLTDLEQRVRRLEQPRAPLRDADFTVLPPARRRSSGAE